jgi:predicted kinase
VSRDDYRFMLRNEPILDPKGEKMVTDLVNSAIATSIKRYNVIVDQTNVNIKYLNSMVEFCEKLADVEFRIFDVPLSIAIKRDKDRDRSVGEEVLRKMYKNYLELFDLNFDFSFRKQKPRIVDNIEWNSNYKLPNAVIFDIDGTLAHNNGKRGYFDWNNVDRDVVDEKVRETLMVFKNQGYQILLVTGRDGSCKELTKMWLKEHKIPYDGFFIRPEGDMRKDTIIKKEIFDNYIKDNFNVLGVFDDRNQVVSMWRSLGLKCFQVIDGDY